MKTSKKLLEAIIRSISEPVERGEKTGLIAGYSFSFFIDTEPTNTLFKFPLNLIKKEREGTVYIGGM